MNSNKQFTFNGKVVTEEVFIEQTLLTCYLICSVIKDDDINSIVNITENKSSVIALRENLGKLDSLVLDDFQQLKVGHYEILCNFYESVIAERDKSVLEMRLMIVGVTLFTIVASIVYFILRKQV